MKLEIHPTPKTKMTVDAEPTNHPELAIHKIAVREYINPISDLATGVAAKGLPVLGAILGEVWCVSHIASGELVIHGLLTKDLALATASMLTASGEKFGKGQPRSFLLDSYQAAACLLTDTYFAQFYKTERGRLAIA